MKIIKTTNRTYVVDQNADGSLTITYNGTNPICNAGMFINQMGGIPGVLARCEEGDYTIEGIKEYFADMSRMKKESQERSRQAALEREAKWNAERVEKYEALVAQYEGQAIPTTYENIGIVLRYLNTQNWGVWNLPKMTIGYSCNQYDCDGKTASTMKLDEPIDIRDDEEKAEEGSLPEMISMFQVGAPRGHLNNYHRC